MAYELWFLGPHVWTYILFQRRASALVSLLSLNSCYNESHAVVNILGRIQWCFIGYLVWRWTALVGIAEDALIYFSDSHLRRNVRNRENSAGNRRRRVRLVWSQSEKTNNSQCSSRYVGSHCVVELLKEDFNVICIDNFVNCQRGKVFSFIEYL